MLFRAKIALRSVCDITPQLLEKLGVCGLLLDIDNTLTTHDNPVPAAGVEAWVAGMQAAGLNVKVNTRLMADKAHADGLEARAEQLLAEFVPQADRVYQTVSNE